MRGRSPLGPIELPEGKHFVELERPGYDRFIRNVHVERGRSTIFRAELIPATSGGAGAPRGAAE